MLTNASASDAFWMPTPTAMLPKPCARSITVLHNRALTLSLPQSVTNMRSSLSSDEWQRFGARQRGITAAEIVDGEIDVEGPQFVCDLVGQRELRDDLLFRHVDDHARPLFEPRAKGLDDVGNGDLGQYFGGNVDGEPHVEAKLGKAEIGFKAPCQGLLGQRDQTCFRSAGHERARREHAELRMPRAREGLYADELFLAQIDLWLVPEFDPVVAQRLIKIDAPGLCRWIARAAVR